MRPGCSCCLEAGPVSPNDTIARMILESFRAPSTSNTGGDIESYMRDAIHTHQQILPLSLRHSMEEESHKTERFGVSVSAMGSSSGKKRLKAKTSPKIEATLDLQLPSSGHSSTMCGWEVWRCLSRLEVAVRISSST